MSHFSNDVKYAFRRLAQSPGFTITALLIVALGVVTNAAMFSVVDGFLFRPSPSRHSCWKAYSLMLRPSIPYR